MKTLKGWNKSKLDLNKYLTEPCQIDEELSLYISECVSPIYCGSKHFDTWLIQGGNAEKYEDSIGFYMTTSISNGKHFYLGILPEFKQ